MSEKSVKRKEAWDKVTGTAKYTGDIYTPGLLYARVCTSRVAHAVIDSIDISKAQNLDGVFSIIVGKDIPVHIGVLVEDRPPIAIEKVRYYGEPVAVVVAKSEDIAETACKLIEVKYTNLPVINNVYDALHPESCVIHPNSTKYVTVVDDVYPEENSNIVSSYKIRKGDINQGFLVSDAVIEKTFSLNKSEHAAMEIRVADAEISASNDVTITSSTQSPFTVKELISKTFGIDEGKVIVKVPFVGGGFGGKSPIFLEALAYIATLAVGGKKVRLIISREQDFFMAPSRLGLEATIKIGAKNDGKIKALEMNFVLDTGAYADISPNMSKAIAANCTGPYNIENLSCDSLCVYTNHNYSTAFRGFSHESYMFCVERVMDEMAKRLKIDPLEFRLKNAIVPGNFSPSMIEITRSNLGDMVKVLEKLRDITNWKEGNYINIGDNKVRVKGIGCFWKAPNPSGDASAGAVITFNSDGSINLNIGSVEMGSGGKTIILKMLSEKLKMSYSRIFIENEINTKTTPKYWKTVASLSGFLVGRAVMNAADDLIDQLKGNASLALRCPVEDLEIENEKVVIKYKPDIGIGFLDLAFGVKEEDGKVIGKQIIGRGSYIIGHISKMAEDTGRGKPGNAWTVGAQLVEMEVDLRDYTYRILKAYTVIDVGKLIDAKTTVGVIQGGMSMGIGLATNESIIYNNEAIPLNTSFRTYKVMHMGAEPRYIVDFIETPQFDSPFGTRAFSEHGILGIPAAIANALSLATGEQIDELPITCETIFKKKRGV